MAPHISEHRCPGDGNAGVPAPRPVTGGGGSWSGNVMLTQPAGVTISSTSG
jgi:hypothetical protein